MAVFLPVTHPIAILADLNITISSLIMALDWIPLMLSPQEFAAAWGEDRYIFPPNVLRDVNIPEDAKTFLLEVGLPLQAEVPLGFFVAPLPLVPASPPVQAAKYPLLSRYSSTHFRLLAYLHYDCWWGNEVYYAIEEITGHIYSVWPEGHGDLGRFVNSSLSQFAESLLRYREFLTYFRPTEPERSQIMPLIASLEQRWQVIDAVAMAEAENYWPYYVYDMEQHL